MHALKMMITLFCTALLLASCSISGPSAPQAIGFPAVERPYSPEKAVENGDVVHVHGRYFNLDSWLRFLKNIEAKQPDHVRITQYTIEGDPLFYEFVFNGKELEYLYDPSMDTFGGQGNGKKTTRCQSIGNEKKEESEHGTWYRLIGCESEEIGSTFGFIVEPNAKLMVQKRIRMENKYEHLKELSDWISVSELQSVINQGEWEKKKITMERPPDYKLYFQSTDGSDAETLRYDVWFTNGMAEIYIPSNSTYKKRSKENSKTLEGHLSVG